MTTADKLKDLQQRLTYETFKYSQMCFFISALSAENHFENRPFLVTCYSNRKDTLLL